MLSREGKQTDRGAVGAEFIGYNRRRREALLLQEFPHQPNCRPSVPAGLNQEIQDFALTVHGTPEIELPPSNYDDHLVQVPAFGRSWPPTLNPPRIGPTEFQDPSSNCLIRDVETTLGKQVLNVPIAQRETAIEPDGMLDDDRWKAVTTVGYLAHSKTLKHRPCRSHAVNVTMPGRDFTAEEMALLRALIAGPPALNRHRLSKAFCRRIGWFKPDGGLKDMMARVTMLDMHRDGLIVLPPKQGRQNRPKPIVFGPDTEPPLFPTPTTLDEVRPLTLRPVVRGTREGKLWNEFIARYHYLGYRTLVGAQMRYAVHDRDGWPVAMLGFSTAAWKLAPRDTFIGWTPQLREKNLPLMVDNPRFLILPWINIPNLGSHILAIIRRRLPEDWTERYNTTPVLIETFVETPRYTGAVYRASGWIHVGATKGRGRYDRDKLYDKPRKDIWLRPLRRDWKRTLNR